MMDIFAEAIGIPPEDEALRPEIRALINEHVMHLPAAVRARSWMGYDAGFSQLLGARGFIGITLPKAYGGGGRSAFARYVVVEELLAAGAPVVAHWIADRQSAPLILNYGTESQKQRFIPPICRGELFFCIGMSEPGSGSDLASVTSRAERTAKGWQVTGHKIWTTNAHRAHFMLALVRTSGSASDRHAGLSQFLIDLSLPGVSVQPIRDIAGDTHFCEVQFDNVTLSEDALIGAEGAGWKQVNSELAFERSGPERILSSMVVMDEWLKTVRQAGRTEGMDDELIGQAAAQLAVLRSMSLAITKQLDNGESPVLQAAILKDLGTGYEQSLPDRIENVLGLQPHVDVPAALRQALDYSVKVAPSFSLRGGTREILRGMIARGCGLR